MSPLPHLSVIGIEEVPVETKVDGQVGSVSDLVPLFDPSRMSPDAVSEVGEGVEQCEDVEGAQ